MAVIQQSRQGMKFYGGAREMWRCRDSEVVLAGPYETGKAQPLSEPVLTPSGWRAMGDLCVGDEVCTPDGEVAQILGYFPQGVQPVYRVTLADGSTTLAAGDHLWEVWSRFNPRATDEQGHRYKLPTVERRQLFTTEQLAGKRLRRRVGSKQELRRKYWVRDLDPVYHDRRDVLIDPYLLGVFLSEGGLTHNHVSFSTADEEMVARCVAALPPGMRVRRSEVSYFIADDAVRGNRILDALRALGLSGLNSFEKFVPREYLYNSEHVRRAVLQGILDGDGTVDARNGSVSFTSVSWKLVAGTLALVRSLGGTGTVSEFINQAGNLTYNLFIAHHAPDTLFYLPRKATAAQRSLPVRRMFDSVEYVGRQECACIYIDHPDHLYITRDYIPTHNTLSCLHKVNVFLAKYPGARGIMVRKTERSLRETVVPTYEQKVLAYPPDDSRCPVRKFGGERPTHYVYPNGSRLVLGGMDKAQKILSSEWDIVYAPQCEELSAGDWEDLTGRTTGRAGNAPYAQVLGDANPGPPGHWIKTRENLTFLRSAHKDNPALYERDASGELTGKLTPQGERSMRVLQALTGLRYKRGYLGLWVGAEGAVYEGWDEDRHLIPRFNVPDDWLRYRVIDFGYTNPLVVQWWAMDNDGRLYLYRELYKTGLTIQEALPIIHRVSGSERYVATIADWDAEDRATLHQGIVNPHNKRVLVPGILTVQADKRVLIGIDAVRERLKIMGDNKPRLSIMRDILVHKPDPALVDNHKPTCTAEEVPYYAYPDSRESRAEDEHPVKVDDHGVDDIRYLTMFIDGPPQAHRRIAGAMRVRRAG